MSITRNQAEAIATFCETMATGLQVLAESLRHAPEEATPGSGPDIANDCPYIDATTFYDTRGAAAVLGCTEGQLRQWRHRNCGPKYQKPSGGVVQYLGLWLIEFQRASVVDTANSEHA